MNHIAIVRSSARAAQTNRMELESGQRNNRESQIEIDSLAEEIRNSGIISLTDSGETNSNHDNLMRNTQESSELIRNLNQHCLEPLSSQTDIDSLVDGESSQTIISDLDTRWNILAANYGNVLKHLKECTNGVVISSINCLDTLDQSVQSACDSIIEQVQAFQQLTEKCNRLIIDLQPSEDLREEIRTLRKSVDTLIKLNRMRLRT